MRVLVIFAICCMAVLAPSQTPRSAAQTPANRCFTVPGITDCITSQEFDAYWTGNGGLPVFGYPVTAEFPERNRDLDELFMTQWFERNRFEAHPENQPPYHVLLGRLGAELLQHGITEIIARHERAELHPHGCSIGSTCIFLNPASVA